MKKSSIVGALTLLLAALLWGLAFIAQSTGLDHLEPLTLNGSRMLLGSVCLIPVVAIMYKLNPETKPKNKQEQFTLLKAGFFAGLCIFIATNAQQYALKTSPVGKASFITSIYVLIVPILGLFLGEKVKLNVWIGIILAVIGLYSLSNSESFYFEKSDILLYTAALFFAVHILVVNHYVNTVKSGVALSLLQFLFASIISIILAFIFETPTLQGFKGALGAVLYAGIASCGVAYTLQIIGQAKTPPTLASIILSMESVFGALSGWLILGQAMGTREIIGCLLMLSAIIIAQINFKERDKTLQ